MEVIGGQRPQQVLDGASYVSVLKGDAAGHTDRAPLYWHFPGYLGAGEGSWRTTPVSVIRNGDWKLLEFLEDRHLELYNLRDDLSETKDLAATMPDKARELHTQLVAWRQEVGAPMPKANDRDKATKDSPIKAKKKKKMKS
jgi:arylsulfatase A-like enzyme